MIRRAFLCLLPLCLGCSLFCPIGGAQPCDEEGVCLPGYACVQGLCVASGDGGGSPGSGCSDSSQCLGGACVAGACANVPWAWSDAGAASASLACYPFPPASLAGNADVTLAGCVDVFPVDAVSPSTPDGGTVQLLEDGYPLGAATPLRADATCASGVGYQIQAPPGQLLQIAVASSVWAGAAVQQGVIAPALPDGGRRDVQAISIDGWSVEAGDLQNALHVGNRSTDGLFLGIVRDCAGRPLSGVQLAAGDGGIVFGYLDDTGAPLAGRTATSPSGRFAAVALAGSYDLSLLASPSAGAAPEAIATLSASVAAGGTAFIDLAPSGP
ncbi:MAG TPA: hypothetical protein VMB50_12465 [Myxococcales bacterium]|nr:hypothetical protein [Myxococcales bacterium]